MSLFLCLSGISMGRYFWKSLAKKVRGGERGGGEEGWSEKI